MSLRVRYDPRPNKLPASPRPRPAIRTNALTNITPPIDPSVGRYSYTRAKSPNVAERAEIVTQCNGNHGLATVFYGSGSVRISSRNMPLTWHYPANFFLV